MLIRRLIWLIFWTVHKSPLVFIHLGFSDWSFTRVFPLWNQLHWQLTWPEVGHFYYSSLLISIWNFLCVATTYFNSWYQSIHSSLNLKCHFWHLQCWCHWWQDVETKVALFQILVILPTQVCLIFFPVLFNSWTLSH